MKNYYTSHTRLQAEHKCDRDGYAVTTTHQPLPLIAMSMLQTITEADDTG